MNKETKEKFVENLKKAMLEMKQDFIEKGKVDIVSCMNKNHMKRCGAKLLGKIDWANVFITDEMVREYANKIDLIFYTTKKSKKVINLDENDPLDAYPPRVIFAHLRKLGYSGTLTFKQAVTV